MALIRCNFFAETLELATSMTVLLPQPAAAQIGVAGPEDDAPPGRSAARTRISCTSSRPRTRAGCRA